MLSERKKHRKAYADRTKVYAFNTNAVIQNMYLGKKSPLSKHPLKTDITLYNIVILHSPQRSSSNGRPKAES